MTNHQNPRPHTSDAKLDTATQTAIELIWDNAQLTKNDPIKLLTILRQLERLHQEIRDTLFQEALPDNRQALYTLLKDIETQGGWPYIYRSRLQELVERLSQAELENLLSNEEPLPPTQL